VCLVEIDFMTRNRALPNKTRPCGTIQQFPELVRLARLLCIAVMLHSTVRVCHEVPNAFNTVIVWSSQQWLTKANNYVKYALR
jgi:hypothetical protein